MIRAGEQVSVRKNLYTVLSVGPSGEGRFFGRQIVRLIDVDGNVWIASSKNGKIAWNASLSPARD